MKILLADDDQSSLNLVSVRLKSWGYDVVTAHDGKEALAALCDPAGPSIALLDWWMPEINGLEVCERVKRPDFSRFVYCIMLTAMADDDSLVTAMERGADDFVTKPFDPHVLRVRVRAGERVAKTTEQLEKLNRTLDEQVRARTEDLETALDFAEHASQMKSIFLANVSHEIRTPLNGIVSYMELLLRSELTEEQRADVLTMKSCETQLRTIVNDLLDFSKIEAGRLKVETAPFDLRATFEETANLVKVAAHQAGLAISLTVEPNVPAQLVGDRVRIQQVLGNLLHNAVKFNTPGGAVVVTVGVAAEDARAGMTNLHIIVADSGIGIAPDKRREIFEAFTQLDGSTTRRYAGTGLGLTICRRLCELLGGSLWVHSAEGFGSAFHFLLPLENVNAAIPQKAAEETFLPLGGGKRLLLAEDNLINQRAIQRLLSYAGYEVVAVTNGAELLDKLDTTPFDLVLLDIQMPELDGPDTAKIIRKRTDKKGRVPLIALTANAYEADAKRYLEIGMDGVVAKPIDYQRLIELIGRFTGLPN